MPTSQLLDLSDVDLSACLMGRAEIARYLPHRGPIAMLDRLIWQDDTLNEGVAIYHVPRDAWWVEGHIPSHPLMPGVLLIEAGAQLASLLYYQRSRKTWFAGFTRIEEVRFRSEVRPGDDLLLLCLGVRYHLKRFVSRVQGLVGDSIVFDGLITGMAMPNVGDPPRHELDELPTG